MVCTSCNFILFFFYFIYLFFLFSKKLINNSNQGAKSCHDGHNVKMEKVTQGYCDCFELCEFCKFKDYLN